MPELSEIKQRARTTWAAGNFDEVAEFILDAGESIVERLDIREGERVLDVGAGTGNASIPAARRGAEVIASDLTPELFEAGRRRAQAAGVELQWVEADAEDLPFEDESFDVVVSTFGHMFAPRHRVAAEEIARVLRPGGRIGLCCWDPTGTIGSFFQLVGKHVGPPPEGVEPPPLWGSRDHAEAMFEGTGIDLEFADGAVSFDMESPEWATEFYSTRFGPVVMARQMLEPEGRWEALRQDLLADYARHQGEDGRVRYSGEYLMILGRKAG